MEAKQETRSSSQDELPQEIHDPLRPDPERVEEATQTIRQVVESASSQFWEANVRATSPKSRLIRTITFVASTWVVFFAIISAFTLLVGWYVYDVRPFHSLERIAREQNQAETKESLGEFHIDLGDALIDVGRVEQAQAEFEKALEIDPLNSEAQKGMVACDLFLAIQDFHSANSDPAVIDEKLKALIDENPDDSRLSQLYAFQGDYFYYYDPEEAVHSYKTAIRLNEENAVAHRGLSTNYYERGMFDEAEREAEKAWESAKWDPVLKTNYADAMLANGHYQQASGAYDDVIMWDPYYIWAYHNAAATSRLTGDLSDSQWYYEQLIGMLQDQEITSIERNQGGYSFTTGSDEWSAVYLYKPSEQQYYAYYGLALTLHLMGNTKEARSYVHKANELRIDPNMKSDVRKLLLYDIDKLRKVQKGLRTRADDFRATSL